ncbi:MAG: cytochrome c nitrite reductase small subunit [Bacteroidales bacterium]|nr:cytochrome c nitrite reductase small subunit [Bacteroidales bacterium]
MKIITNIVKSIRSVYPPEKWRISVIILLGVITGMGFYIFYVSKAWTYLSDDPKTCVNCHIMRPEYVTWRQSSHNERAVCMDCHVPQDNFFRTYYFKAKDGLRHSAIFTIRGYDQSIRMLEPGRKVVQENCIRCHERTGELVGTNVSYKDVKHGNGKQCWDCHREVPHGRVKSLSATPYSYAPVPESPVPQWLQKLTGTKRK